MKRTVVVTCTAKLKIEVDTIDYPNLGTLRDDVVDDHLEFLFDAFADVDAWEAELLPLVKCEECGVLFSTEEEKNYYFCPQCRKL